MSTPAQGFLPYGRQQIGEDDIEAVAAALRADFLTTGPLVASFENALAALTGARHAVACANGTAALHLAALALDLDEECAVIVPAVTFLATANAARFAGAEVVFCDVDPDTGLMTAETFEAALARVPANLTLRATIPVHLRGAICNLPAIAAVASKHGATIVEDAAHAVGSVADWSGVATPVGASAYSAMTCFSFHPVKTIAMGEGGAVTTNDEKLDKRLRLMRSHGMVHRQDEWSQPDLGFANGAPNPWYYEMPEPGFNYRLTDIQCALGLSQLAKIARFVARRAELVAHYDDALHRVGSNYIRPHVSPIGGDRPAWHLYSARIDFDALGVTRGEVMRRLRAVGVGSQVHYIPVHLQPYYLNRYGAIALPGAERYYARTLSLPLFPAMRDEDVDRVVAALATAVGTAAA